MLAFLLSLLLQAQPSSPCSSAEYRQFDFWVGDWLVHNPKGQQVGTNRIEKIENGCGILENWTNARGATGRSINVYRPSSRTWVQVWAGSDGLTLLLEGAYQDGRMVLAGESMSPKQTGLRDRVTWSRLDGGRVRQYWEQSADDGRTWTVAFEGIYSPRRTADGVRP